MLNISGSLTQTIQWSSEVWDIELGLVYYNWRYYNITVGRWIYRDFTIGHNLYKYISNDTMSDSDIMGLDSSKDKINTRNYENRRDQQMVSGRAEKRINQYNIRSTPIQTCKTAKGGMEDAIHTVADVIYAALIAFGIVNPKCMEGPINEGIKQCFKHRDENKKSKCFCCSITLETTNGSRGNIQVINYHLYSVIAFPLAYCNWNHTQDAIWSRHLIYPTKLTRYPKEADDLFRFGETIVPIEINYKI